MSSSHGHGHSYSHGHSYNYGQSQGYNQPYGHDRPYNRVSHSHHRRRYNCSPEGNPTYSTADTAYQHNIRESERDRDFKCRDKYTDRAPIETKEEVEKDRSTHDRCERGTDGRKRSSKMAKRTWNPSGINGDWSEHISSSGKKYYYNCVSEVSQWEKPKEWHDRRSSRYSYSSSRSGHERHEPRPERESDRSERTERTSHKRTSNTTHSSSQWRNNRPEYEEPRPRASSTVVHETNEEQCAHNVNESHSRNTPLPPESKYSRSEYDPRNYPHATALPRVISHSASNGSSTASMVTPPPPPTEIHHFKSPPTPTHSENHVEHTVVIETPIRRKYEYGTYGSVCSIPGPSLTSSLSHYVRNDLVDHVTDWPAEVLEKQAQRFCDDGTNLGKQITRVSAELKCARSIVREREIQATLQEQKIMYLRQQIIELEESMSQNSIMCDDLCH
ncbi:uncharacterized protein LOC143922936 isoform X2 [Arctopsyche grandis]